MRLLMIGGAGFIGTEIVRQASQRGHQVLVLDKPHRISRVSDLLKGIETVPYDFGERSIAQACALQPTDVVLHLGWTTVPATSMKAPVADVSSNVVASMQLFQDLAEAGVTRVVFASSGGTVYGDPESQPVSENHSTRPKSMYGASKLAVERYLALYPTLQGVSLRVGNPYGSYQFRGGAVGAAAGFISSVLSGREIIIYGDGSISRDYLSIEDVARAFLAAADSGLPPGEYNVGSGQCLSLSELIDLVSRLSGRQGLVRHVAPRGFDVQRIALDHRKLTEGCGWVPETELAQGIGSLIAGFESLRIGENVEIRKLK